MPTPAIDNIGPVLEDVLRLFLRDVRVELATLELTWAESRSLVLIGDTPGLSQAQLAQELGIRPISLVRRVDNLEKRKLLKRVPSPTDRRANQLFLTKAGEMLSDKIRQMGVALVRESARELTATEINATIAGLQKIRAALAQR